MKDIKIEKLILLTTILFGLILFIDYVFGISNLIHVYDKELMEMHLKRNIFLHLYSVSLIHVLGFYSLCSYNRNTSNKPDNEPEILLNSTQPFITFILGYYLYMLFIDLRIDLRIILTITIQYIFFMTISQIFLFGTKWIVNKWIKSTEKLRN